LPESRAPISDTPTPSYEGPETQSTWAPPPVPAQSWDAALESHYVELCEYVLRLVGSAEAAEDLVQDLFLNLWKTRGPRDAERLTRPYLFAAARNAALKYLRHRRVVDAWIERASREEPPTAASPSDLCIRRDLEDAVARAIVELPPRCREIFLLRRRDQLSYQEIAARAGVSVGTVKCQMWRAMVLLREKLTPYLALISPLVGEGVLNSLL
jgi:RNA polymerase sigma-70 factor (ECF subfamily)